MNFEFDENKDKANMSKHGIDFTFAIEVFDDQNMLEIVDDRKDYGELRYLCIGQTLEGLVLVIVATNRNNSIRIISVRRANTKEREKYYNFTQ